MTGTANFYYQTVKILRFKKTESMLLPITDFPEVEYPVFKRW